MSTLSKSKGSKSLYTQIKEIYKNKIMNGEIQVGDKIPSELEIQQEFNVSRITARQAILDLEKEGMVQRGRGKGTFVIWKQSIEEELSHIKSFTDEMKSRNIVPGTASLSVEKVVVNEEISKEYNIPMNQEVYCIKRVRTADNVKLVYCISYFPLMTNLPMDPEAYEESIYKMLDYTGIGMPTKVDEKISAVLPSEEVVEALNIQKTLPVLLRERISFNEKGDLIEYSHLYYRGDLYKYSISATE